MTIQRLEPMISWGLALFALSLNGCGARVAVEDGSGTGGATSTSYSTGTNTGIYTVSNTAVSTGYTTSSGTWIGGTGVYTGYTSATSTAVYTASVSIVQTYTATSTFTSGGCPLTSITTAGQLTVAGGYVTAGSLRGYGYTWVGDLSTPPTCITPKCSSTGCTPAFPPTALCASGIVGADVTYQSVAGLGFNLNQNMAGDPLGYVAAPAFLTVDAFLASGFARVQLSGANGNYYCVEAGKWAPGVPIPITNFNTSCWDNSGMTLYQGSPVSAINLVVPSNATAMSRFALCLTNVTFM